jgi:HK97 family phage portal protein
VQKSLMEVISLGLRRSPRAEVIATGTLADHNFWRGGNSSFTGESVDTKQSLKLSTVWGCVRLIAETLSTLPLGFFRRKSDGSREFATSHNLYELLHSQPNADQTAVVFWEAVVASMLLWGNGFIEIVRSAGQVVSLRFLIPSRLTRRPLKSGNYEYFYRDDVRSQGRVIAHDNVMHIPAFTIDGDTGLSPIIYGANVFGSAIDTDRAAAQTFHDSLRSPGIITMDMILQGEQREQIRAHVKSISESGGVMVLEKGTAFHKLGFDPVSAELLKSREWNVEEICRWFRVDPSMVGHGSKDSNWGTGLEQKMLWFITFTLRNWCVKIEQAVRKNLLTPVERQTYFAEFAIEGLLRGDSAARATFYSTMTQNGIMTRDECRVKENLPRMGGNADELTVQSNMTVLQDLGKTEAPTTSFEASLRAFLGLDVTGQPK